MLSEPTVDQVRLAYALSKDNRDMSLYRYDREAGLAEWDRIRDEAYAEFDRALQAHDRQVAAKALTDASWAHLMDTSSPAEVRDMLRARAASLVPGNPEPTEGQS